MLRWAPTMAGSRGFQAGLGADPGSFYGVATPPQPRLSGFRARVSGKGSSCPNRRAPCPTHVFRLIRQDVRFRGRSDDAGPILGTSPLTLPQPWVLPAEP